MEAQQSVIEGQTEIQEVNDALLDQVISRSEREFELLQRKASIASASRMYPDAVTMEAAAVKMMMAETLGIDPMVALTDIRVIDGKPEVSAGLTAALLQRAGYDWQFIRHDATVCEAAFTYGGSPLLDKNGKQVVCSFSMEDAKRGDMSERGHTDKKRNNYDKFPKNMLFARMITNFCKWFAPRVTRGMTTYAPGEIQTQAEAAQESAAAATSNKTDELKARISSARSQSETTNPVEAVA